MTRRVHICSFSGGLADLKWKHHGHDDEVIAVLREDPMFSVWDATKSPRLARTLTRLLEQGRIRYVADPGFPWCKVEVVR